jgi:DNA-binding transcriptional MerR regulator
VAVMAIKEVEQTLRIPRANIRFYEKKNLIHPERGANAYREYSEEDVATLKKIIILRKIGISVGDIEEVLNENVPLSELIDKNIIQLQEQIAELNGALKISQLMKNNQEELSSFDEAFYWEEIHREEKDGNKFLDIAKDILHYEKSVFLDWFGLADYNGNLNCTIWEAIRGILIFCSMYAVLWYFGEGRNIDDAIEGFFTPFIYVAIAGFFGLPIYLIGRKHPKLAKTIKKIGMWIAVIFTIGILILILLDYLQ